MEKDAFIIFSHPDIILIISKSLKMMECGDNLKISALTNNSSRFSVDGI